MSGELDRHSIVIRKRSLLESADLMFCVLRTHFGSLFSLFFLLVIPFYGLNYFLMKSLGTWDAIDAYEFASNTMVYCCILVVLQSLELQFVASLMITYLGMLVFMPDDNPKKISAFIRWFMSMGQIVFYLVLLRPILFAFFPFLTQIIVLEKTPFVTQNKNTLSTWKRTKRLHRSQFGETMVVFFAGTFLGFWAAFGICVTATSTVKFLFSIDDITNSFWIVTLIYPFVFWFVMLYFSVFQFLRYLDLRIEREGWDVELALRAERARIGDKYYT